MTGRALPGIVNSVRVGGSLLFESKTEQSGSKSVMLLQGWKDADISVGLTLIDGGYDRGKSIADDIKQDWKNNAPDSRAKATDVKRDWDYSIDPNAKAKDIAPGDRLMSKNPPVPYAPYDEAYAKGRALPIQPNPTSRYDDALAAGKDTSKTVHPFRGPDYDAALTEGKKKDGKEEGQSIYEQLATLNGIFRKVEDGSPVVYILDHPHLKARGIRKVVFSDLESNEVGDGEIVCSLKFTEYEKKVAPTQAQQQQTQAAKQAAATKQTVATIEDMKKSLETKGAAATITGQNLPWLAKSQNTTQTTTKSAMSRAADPTPAQKAQVRAMAGQFNRM
jgi:hypothetical protein